MVYDAKEVKRMKRDLDAIVGEIKSGGEAYLRIKAGDLIEKLGEYSKADEIKYENKFNNACKKGDEKNARQYIKDIAHGSYTPSVERLVRDKIEEIPDGKTRAKLLRSLEKSVKKGRRYMDVHGLEYGEEQKWGKVREEMEDKFFEFFKPARKEGETIGTEIPKGNIDLEIAKRTADGAIDDFRWGGNPEEAIDAIMKLPPNLRDQYRKKLVDTAESIISAHLNYMPIKHDYDDNEIGWEVNKFIHEDPIVIRSLKRIGESMVVIPENEKNKYIPLAKKMSRKAAEMEINAYINYMQKHTIDRVKKDALMDRCMKLTDYVGEAEKEKLKMRLEAIGTEGKYKDIVNRIERIRDGNISVKEAEKIKEEYEEFPKYLRQKYDILLTSALKEGRAKSKKAKRREGYMNAEVEKFMEQIEKESGMLPEHKKMLPKHKEK